MWRCCEVSITSLIVIAVSITSTTISMFTIMNSIATIAMMLMMVERGHEA